MAKFTVKEKKWLEKVQAVLDECPSDRIAFFTTGDNIINAYDVNKYDEISDLQDSGTIDFGTATDRTGASFGQGLKFNNAVESTAG